MPIVVPPFVAYQAPLFPVPGKWNLSPPEGDKFVPCEIDWGITAPIGRAVQFTLSSGPVEFSQIIAMSVDNGRNGGSVSFLFPDTGKQLTLPPFAMGTYPVFTNSLTFYVAADGSNPGDVTVFEILNSMPPPVSVLPSQLQTHSGATGINIAVNGTTQVVPAGVNGTLQGFSIGGDVTGTAGESAGVTLQDGTGTVLWATVVSGVSGIIINAAQSGLNLRFINGLKLIVSGTSVASGTLLINLYYSVP